MIIDLVCLLLLVMAAFKGFSKGLIMAIFSFVALFVGLAAALKLSSVVANYFSSLGNDQFPWWPVIAFVAVFLVAALLVRMAGSVLEKTVELAQLGWINKIGGFLVYGLMYLLLYSVVLFFARQLHLLSPETISHSRTFPLIEPWGPWTMDGLGKLIPAFRDVFEDLKTFFGKVGEDLPRAKV